jgi:hypothetical protein
MASDIAGTREAATATVKIVGKLIKGVAMPVN